MSELGRETPTEKLRIAFALIDVAERMLRKWRTCNFGSNPFRCAMLDSLFSWGSVTDWDFPSGMATFQ